MRKGGYRSDNQRKAMFANMAQRKGRKTGISKSPPESFSRGMSDDLARGIPELQFTGNEENRANFNKALQKATKLSEAKVDQFVKDDPLFNPEVVKLFIQRAMYENTGDKPEYYGDLLESVTKRYLSTFGIKYKTQDDGFMESYPVGKVYIPPQMIGLSLLDKCHFLQNEIDKPVNFAMLTDPREHTEKEDLKILKEYEKKGYVELTKNGNDILIKLLPGGFARAIKDSKGEYAKFLESNLDMDKVKDVANRLRQALIVQTEDEIQALQKELRIHSAIAKNEFIDADDYDRYVEGVKYFNNRIEQDQARISALKTNEIVISGDEKFVSDVKYVLDNYFDVDSSFLRENTLHIKLVKSISNFAAQLSYDSKNPYGHSHFILNLNQLADFFRLGEDLDIKTSNVYLDTLVHELTHWLRAVDIRRAYLDPVLKAVPNYSTDKVKEEKNTVMETAIRAGKRFAFGDQSYYTYVRPEGYAFNKHHWTSKPMAYDNAMLTMNRNIQSDIPLPLVAEDIIMRGATTRINSLVNTNDNPDWLDAIFENDKGRVFEVYTPDFSKKFDSAKLAEEIDMQDGISGNENIYQWRKGKKFLIRKEKKK